MARHQFVRSRLLNAEHVSYWFLLLSILSFVLCFACRMCLPCFLFDILLAAILLSFIMPSLILLSFCMDCELCCPAIEAMLETTIKVATKIAVVNFFINILILPFMICGDSHSAGSRMQFIQHW